MKTVYEVGTIFKSFPKIRQLDILTKLSMLRVHDINKLNIEKREHPFYIEEIDRIVFLNQESNFIKVFKNEIEQYKKDDKYIFLKDTTGVKINFHSNIVLNKQTDITKIKPIRVETFEKSYDKYTAIEFIEELVGYEDFRIVNMAISNVELQKPLIKEFINNLKINILFDEKVNDVPRVIYTVVYKNKILSLIDDFYEYKDERVEEVFEDGIQYDLKNDLNILNKNRFLSHIKRGLSDVYLNEDATIKLSDCTDDKIFVIEDEKLSIVKKEQK